MAGAAASSLALVAIAVVLARHSAGGPDFARIRRVNVGFGFACEARGEFIPRPQCRNTEEPETLVWGDSFAEHLVPGILATEGRTPLVVQATRSVCGPLLGLATIEDSTHDEDWAKSCIHFNESVVDYLRATESVKTIVLSSPFSQFVGASARLLKWDARRNAYEVGNGSIAEGLDGMRRTVEAVRALGKRVVVVAPPPASGFDVGHCLERVARGLPVTGVAGDCSVRVEAYHLNRQRVLEFLALLPHHAGVNVISFDSLLCNAERCRTSADGIFIYRDGGHLSYDGSAWVAKAISFSARIHEKAW